MEVRLVVTDLDGTVLRASGGISRATRAAFALARQRGATVSVATGRSPASAGRFAALLGASGPLICLDGALVLDGERPLWQRPMPAPLAQEACALAAGLGGGWIALTRWGRVHGGPSPRPPQAALRSVLRHPVRALRFYASVRRERASRADRPPAEPVYKLLLWAPPGEGRAALREGLARLPLRVPSGPGPTVEVVAPEAHKGAALAVVVEHLGLAPHQVVAFGDGLNDLEMLAFAGHGVAMGGAPEALRAVAAAETASVEDDGVARELRRLLGGRGRGVVAARRGEGAG